MQSNHQKCPLKWLVNHLHQRLSAKNFQAHSKPETDKLRRDWMMNHQFLLEVRRIEKMIKVMMTKFSHIFQVLLSIFWHFISVHIYFTLSKVNVRFCIVCISSSWCSPKKSNGLLTQLHQRELVVCAVTSHFSHNVLEWKNTSGSQNTDEFSGVCPKFDREGSEDNKVSRQELTSTG